jgi:hypothetical protein
MVSRDVDGRGDGRPLVASIYVGNVHGSGTGKALSGDEAAGVS